MHARSLSAALVLTFAAASAASAQWTNRYPRFEGSGHHVYVEGFEFPSVDAGVLDPMPAPVGNTIAFASRGWIWVMDLETRVARRVTSGGHMDSRPAWSPDGRSIAFVRDDTRRTWIVIVDAATGAEQRMVEHGPVSLDPAFSRDGRHLFYASSAAGDLDIWRMDLATGAQTRVTAARRQQLRPQPHPDGERLIYLLKAGEDDEVRVRNADSTEVTLLSGGLLSQTRPALSPDGRHIVAQRPTHDGTWELVLIELARPSLPVVLTHDHTPQTPAWSADGQSIYFVESDAGRNFRLRRIAFGGGPITDVPVARHDWGAAETGVLRITTRMSDATSPARLHVVDAQGHPALPDPGQVWFDGQHGRVFFYSPGVIELVVPAGAVTATAVRGLTTPAVTITANVAPNSTQDVVLELEPVWDAQANGWYSGDHHFHLNYGGQHALEPHDLVPMMRGENLDVGTPLLGSLNNRFEDQHLWGQTRTETPIVRFGQEVRAHFHGHAGLIGTESLFWPWVWGPGNPVYNQQDISNSHALQHARGEGGMSIYVHPISARDPFNGSLGAIPLELIPDAVLGDLDAIELACLWTSELGTAEVWYRLLNVGAAIVPTAGTDVMKNYFRTMAVGTTRVYVRPDGPLTFDSYLAALDAGRSFVTTGPMLDFRIGDVRPGGVINGDNATWSLDVHSAVPFERVELLVNGAVVWTGAGMSEPGSMTHTGTTALPDGGWIAIRAYSETSAEWPVMNTIPFAHTAPIWIGAVGSTDADAARAAAADLLRALDSAEQRLNARYGDADIPQIRERFTRARAVLTRT